MKEIKCGIYCIRNIVNNKRIIGSSKNIHKRWSRYRFDLKNNKYDNPHLQSSYNKYGKENFSYEIINECQEENLLEIEDYYILAFSTLNRKYGYNLQLASRPSHGAESRLKMSIARKGKKFSDAHKKSMSIAHKGMLVGSKNPHFGKHPSKETLEKMSKAMKGKISWIKGKKHTLEAKNKMKKARKGRVFSELTKQRISQANMGKKHSNETKQKMRDAKMGKYEGINNPFFGKHHSPATREKIKESLGGENHPNFGKHLPEETKKKISVANSGKNNCNYGKSFSKEYREKLSRGQLNRKDREAMLQRLRTIRMGKHNTKEQNEKISQARKKYWQQRKLKLKALQETLHP